MVRYKSVEFTNRLARLFKIGLLLGIFCGRHVRTPVRYLLMVDALWTQRFCSLPKKFVQGKLAKPGSSISGLREDQVHLDHPHGVLRIESAAAARDRVGREGPGEQNQRSVF